MSERVRGDVAQLPLRAQRLAHTHRHLARLSPPQVSGQRVHKYSRIWDSNSERPLGIFYLC